MRIDKEGITLPTHHDDNIMGYHFIEGVGSGIIGVSYYDVTENGLIFLTFYSLRVRD